MIFGSFTSSDVLLQAEFVAAAASFDAASSPFALVKESTMPVLINRLTSAHRDRPTLPRRASTSLCLLVSKSEKSEILTTQLFFGPDIQKTLRSIVRKHGHPDAQTPLVKQLMESGSSKEFELFGIFLATHLSVITKDQSSLEDSLKPDRLRGLNGRTLAHFAAASSSKHACFRDLFQRSCSCDVNGFTTLHVAAKHGQLQHIDAILAGESADVTHSYLLDLRTPSGLSALHLAAKFGHTDVVGRLLSLIYHVDAGIDIDDHLTKSGRTALQLAVLSSPERPGDDSRQ